MRLHSAAALAAALLLPATLAAQAPVAQAPATSTVIRGTLVGADGRPMPLAHAIIYQGTAEARDSVVAAADGEGRFTVATTATGPVFVSFSGVGHDPMPVQLFLDAPQPTPLEMDVRLARAAVRDSFVNVRAVGDFNDFASRTAKPLARQPDGTWTLEVETAADTLAYQLLGVLRSGYATGTDTDRHVPGAWGAYRSVIPARGGKATIVFDPRRLPPPATAEARLAFRDSTARAARAARVAAVLASMRGHLDRSMAAQRQVGSDSAPKPDWNAPAAALMPRIDAERDSLVRAAMLLELMILSAFDAEVPARFGEQTLREIPPASPLWTLPLANQFGIAFSAHVTAASSPGRPVTMKTDTALARRYAAWTDSALAAHDDTGMRVDLLARAASVLATGPLPALGDAFLQRLASDYPDAPMTKSVLARLGAGRVLQVGKTVPAFRFASLADSTQAHTLESLAGKYVLLDFWATWCSPCIGEMPVLHAAYERFRPRGFEILSISADASPAVVRSFREGRWKMPWLHSFAEDGLEHPTLKAFEIRFLPRTVLIDGTGKIVAVDDELRGEQLAETLERVLK